MVTLRKISLLSFEYGNPNAPIVRPIAIARDRHPRTENHRSDLSHEYVCSELKTVHRRRTTSSFAQRPLGYRHSLEVKLQIFIMAIPFLDGVNE